jgi:hypothetical protein
VTLTPAFPAGPGARLFGDTGFVTQCNRRRLGGSWPARLLRLLAVGPRLLGQALARLASSFSPEDDGYIDGGNRRQHSQYDNDADRRADQVQRDGEDCAADQTEHGKPQPQGKSTGSWRCAADPGHGVVVARQASAKSTLTIRPIAALLVITDHILRVVRETTTARGGRGGRSTPPSSSRARDTALSESESVYMSVCVWTCRGGRVHLVHRVSAVLLAARQASPSFSLVAAVILLGWTLAGSPGIFG